MTPGLFTESILAIQQHRKDVTNLESALNNMSECGLMLFKTLEDKFVEVLADHFQDTNRDSLAVLREYIYKNSDCSVEQLYNKLSDI